MSRASSDPTTSRGSGPRPRLILVDDNIRDRGGHYFELASLLLEGAKSLGYSGVLGTNRDFEKTGKTSCPWEIHRVFTTRRMVRWSLGVDGHSKLERDSDGHPIGGSSLQNLFTRTSDFFGPAEKRPSAMIQRWSDGLVD